MIIVRSHHMQDYVCVEDMLSRPVAAAPHTVHPPEEESFELFNTQNHRIRTPLVYHQEINGKLN